MPDGDKAEEQLYHRVVARVMEIHRAAVDPRVGRLTQPGGEVARLRVLEKWLPKKQIFCVTERGLQERSLSRCKMQSTPRAVVR